MPWGSTKLVLGFVFSHLVYAISQAGAFLILSKANIQYGLTLSKALDKLESKTQAELSPSRIL